MLFCHGDFKKNRSSRHPATFCEVKPHLVDRSPAILGVQEAGALMSPELEPQVEAMTLSLFQNMDCPDIKRMKHTIFKKAMFSVFVLVTFLSQYNASSTA